MLVASAGNGDEAGWRPQIGLQGFASRSPRDVRVLIVEDEWLISTEIEAALRDAGYLVIGVAGSAEAAFDMAAQEEPHIATMDIRLGGGQDGVDVAKSLYQQFGVRSLFISAHANHDSMRRAETARPLGWLPKPFMERQLLRALETALKDAAEE
jgi:two-component system, response regulator PdtaR